ncbi:MAG: hypothetical protein EA379_08670 [Phycisphaerales bacterium]|nr:MAG: hypothetical protein EA379_08670 [Phycisphaerales bacterium]
MSCCPGPKHGPEFDPDREAPSEADVARFSEGYDEDEGWHDDEAFDDLREPDAGKAAQKKIIAFVAVLVAIAFLLSYVL